MKPFIDYYAILGISLNATTDEIKTAFKNQSLKWHPDRNRGIDTTKKMQEINEAKRILSDKVLKLNYNRDYSRFKESSTTNNKKGKQGDTTSHSQPKTGANESVKPNYSCNCRTDEDLFRICANASKYSFEFIGVVLRELYKRNYSLEYILARIKQK
jgi:curved DNA-binding protein CbpA